MVLRTMNSTVGCLYESSWAYIHCQRICIQRKKYKYPCSSVSKMTRMVYLFESFRLCCYRKRFTFCLGSTSSLKLEHIAKIVNHSTWVLSNTWRLSRRIKIKIILLFHARLGSIATVDVWTIVGTSSPVEGKGETWVSANLSIKLKIFLSYIYFLIFCYKS